MKERQSNSISIQVDRSKLEAEDPLWVAILSECKVCIQEEALLRDFLQNAILSQNSLEGSLSWILAQQLKSDVMTEHIIQPLINETLLENDTIRKKN